MGKTSEHLFYAIDYAMETFQEANRSDTKQPHLAFSMDTSFLFHFKTIFMFQSLLDQNVSVSSSCEPETVTGILSFWFQYAAPVLQDFYAKCRL